MFGFVLDRVLGGVVEIYSQDAFTGKPRFDTTGINFGLAYKL